MEPWLEACAGRQVGSVALRRADSAQTRSEKLARIVLDAMYQFVGLLDADGRTLEINRAALDGAGVRIEDLRGKPFWEARWFQISRETTEMQRDFVRRARGGEFIRCDMEIYGQAAGDETIVVDFSLLPVRDDRGRVVFLLAEGRNITEKNRAEAEVSRKNAELESLLERVRQLDQLKSDLFANVSHELRTPLALILGPAEELLDTGAGLSDAQRRQLQVIQRNAATLLKRVNDLLDLARLDARRMDVQYARIDLAALVREQAEQFHALAPQRQLRYAVVAPPDHRRHGGAAPARGARPAVPARAVRADLCAGRDGRARLLDVPRGRCGWRLALHRAPRAGWARQRRPVRAAPGG